MRESSTTVLLVEDDPKDVGLVRDMLAGRPQDHITLIVERSLSGALACMQGRPLDLVLLNNSLPDASPDEAITTALCHSGGVPVMVLADHSDDDCADRAIQQGVQDYLSKDAITARTFMRSLHLAIERQRMVRDLKIRVRELAASRSRYQSLVRESADAMIVIDADGRLLYANPAAESFFGQSAAELIDESHMIPLQSGSDGRIAIDRPDGGRASGQMRIAPGHWGPKPAWVVTIRDTTREDELAQARQSAQQAKAVKSRFLAGVSHELRTPLNSILGYAEAMKMELFGPVGSERYREYVGNIFQSGHQLLDLIDDLLDLSRAEGQGMAIKDDPVDLVMAAKTAIGASAKSADRKSVSISLECAQPAVHISGDGLRLMQVFLSLLSNAVKFNKPGGTVTVSIDDKGAAGIFVTVSDSGIGIGRCELQSIFEPFTRHGNERAHTHPGTDVGLSLTRRLVELHDGAIGIHSRLNEGTTVEIVFPDSRRAAGRPDEVPMRITA